MRINLTFESRLFLFMVLVFLSRLPFLDLGYGSEEDAWGLYLTAKNIALNSRYEVSRLPGHPVQELFYAFIWNSGPKAFNVITALLGTLGLGFFVSTLRNIGIRNYFIAGLTLAFIPIIYIHSTNAMDYMWALSFAMASWYLVTERKYVLAGIALGIAAGCRITTLAMALPILLYIIEPLSSKTSIKNIIVYLAATTITSVIVFVPVINNYGLGFFDYYKHWPYPPIALSLYKFTVASWGIIGFLDLLVALLIMFFVMLKRPFILLNYRSNLVLLSAFVAIVLFTISFWMVPFKAAFIIPILPFVVLLLSIYLKEIHLKAFCFSMLISCFFLGLNAVGEKNSANHSNAAFLFEISGRQLAIDVWNGPLKEDLSKRKTRSDHANRILEQTDQLERPAILISGYWYNFILGSVNNLEKPTDLEFVYYLDEDDILKYRSEGFHVYTLSDQILLNDLRYKKKFTKELTAEFTP
ncbi:MAG: hypothetical protein HKN22_08735 [Bacteroidia bacterium]|nr:hypothetical protein [Bacteroidia bacterium]